MEIPEHAVGGSYRPAEPNGITFVAEYSHGRIWCFSPHRPHRFAKVGRHKTHKVGFVAQCRRASNTIPSGRGARVEQA